MPHFIGEEVFALARKSDPSRVTIRAVAKAAGVSPATASNVLTGKRQVHSHSPGGGCWTQPSGWGINGKTGKNSNERSILSFIRNTVMW